MALTSCHDPGDASDGTHRSTSASADGNGVSFQQHLFDISNAGGGDIGLATGEKVTIQNGLIIPPNVRLDLNGGTIHAILHDANTAGVRLTSNAHVSNGSVKVTSKGSPGIQSGAHAAVLIGALLGENPTVADLSPFEAPSHWTLRNLTLETDKSVQVKGFRLGAPAIQIMGGAKDGAIEDIIVPDNDTMQGGVMIDWGMVGPIASSDVVGASRLFREGSAYTTHPSRISIKNVTIGRLNRTAGGEAGSFGIRLSGCNDIDISAVHIMHAGSAGIYHTLGDLGYEFACDQDQGKAAKGIRLSDITINSCGNYGIRSDSYADNVGRAVEAGYRRRSSPVASSDIVFDNVRARAGQSAREAVGIRVDHQRGGRFTNIILADFGTGLLVDAGAESLQFSDVIIDSARDQAVLVGHKDLPPSNIGLERINTRGAGRGSRLINIEKSRGVTLSATTGAQIQRAPSARDIATH